MGLGLRDAPPARGSSNGPDAGGAVPCRKGANRDGEATSGLVRREKYFHGIGIYNPIFLFCTISC